jgi:hypothetical protein
MTSSLQDWKNLLAAQGALIGAMDDSAVHHHDKADVMRALARCLVRFEQDYTLAERRLARFFDFPAFESDKGRYVSVIKNSLSEWQNDGPALPALLAAFFAARPEPFDVCREDALVRAALIGAVLGEVSHAPDPLQRTYHSNIHFREVALLNMICLCGEEYLSGDTVSLSIAARQLAVAMAHDLFHTGGDNIIDGQHVAYYLEERSFEAFKPYMHLCGVSEEDMDDIHVSILVTEIARCGERPYSAHQYLRQAYLHHFEGGAKPDLPPELARLIREGRAEEEEKGKTLTRLCVRMQESDTVASVLDEDSFFSRYKLLQNENPDKYPPGVGLGKFIHFLGYIFHSGLGHNTKHPELLSPFFQRWVQPRIRRVYEDAKERAGAAGL